MPSDSTTSCIKPSIFLNTIFEGLTDTERVAITLAKGGWVTVAASPRWLQRLDSTPGTGAWYFCVSSVRPPQEFMTRGREDLRFAYCIVLDDIGTKAAEPPVAPSWVLESSQGNFQYGYLIDPLELDTPGLALYEGSAIALANAGFSDAGAGGSYRVMRIPGSLHKTGFVARVTQWHPERSWELSQLMDEMEVTPTKVREKKAGKKADHKHVPLAEVDDPLYDWMRENCTILGDNGSRWVHMVCPWVKEHSDGAQGPAATSYSPAGFGDAGRAWSCMHEHCQHRNTKDFFAWAYSQGAPEPGAQTRRMVQPALLDDIIRGE